MDTTADRATPHPSLIVLLFAALGAPAAWAVHLLLNYFLVSAICWTGASGIMALVHIVTVVSFLVALAAGVVAWRTWRSHGQVQETAHGDWAGVSTFLGVWGIAASGIFALLILVGGVAGFFLDPCRSI